jgi:hypothetical protein
MPRIAQDGVNHSSFVLFDLQFLNPTASTITLVETARLNNLSLYTPSLGPFNAGLWLVTNGTFGPQPFTTIDFPAIYVLHPAANVSFDGQVVTITDQDQLAQYASQALSQENVTIALTGSPKLHEGKRNQFDTAAYNSCLIAGR